MEIDTVLAIITALTSFTTATVLIFTYRLDKKRDLPQFALIALSFGRPPNSKPYGIHIQNPTKPINRCQIFCNGFALDVLNVAYLKKWVYVHVGGEATFSLPNNLTDLDNAVIVIKDGKKNIYPKVKFKDIPCNVTAI